MINLSYETKLIRHSVAVAAGVTTITPGSGIDMTGFDNCMFIAAFGPIVAGAATSIKVQQSSDNGVSDTFDDLAGTSVTVLDTYDDKLVYVEVARPLKRYLRLIVLRATQNATLDGIVAILSNPKITPTTQDTTVAAGETWISPDEGTP